jgi:acyl-homoserine lactone acylase PvdQ
MPTQAPPDVPLFPNMSPAASQALADYLRRLSTWAYQEINRKIAKDEATAHLILAAYDVKQNPNIFQIEVTSSGTLQANPVALGGANPSVAKRG